MRPKKASDDSDLSVEQQQIKLFQWTIAMSKYGINASR